MSTLTRTADRPGERADAFLARVVPDLTRSAAQRLLEAGAVRLAGRPVRKNYRTAPGDVLEVDIPRPPAGRPGPPGYPPGHRVRGRGRDLVNKPGGDGGTPRPRHSDGTLVNALLYHCGNTLLWDQRHPAPRHRPPHRPGHQRPESSPAKNDAAHLGTGGSAGGIIRWPVPMRCLAVGNFRQDSATVDAPSAAAAATARRWRWWPKDAPPSPIGRCWPGIPVSPTCAADWRRAVPTRSGSIWLYRPSHSGGHRVRQ